MLSTGRARFHVEHKLSTGYTQGKCEDALGYLLAQILHSSGMHKLAQVLHM